MQAWSQMCMIKLVDYHKLVQVENFRGQNIVLHKSATESVDPKRRKGKGKGMNEEISLRFFVVNNKILNASRRRKKQISMEIRRRRRLI